MNYRSIAKNHLKQSREALDSQLEHQVKYAALELRMAIEAITYDRAQSYKDEFPPEQYQTWQPRKVMKVLLEIDSFADRDSSLLIGRQLAPSSKPETMRSLGTEAVFSLKLLNKHYDALGSYLHIPTMKQSLNGKKHDLPKLRSRCEEIYSFLDKSLSSPIYNVTLGSFTKLECLECGETIRKRVSPRAFEEPATVNCFNCKVRYLLSNNGNGQFIWDLIEHPIRCGNEDCQTEFILLDHQIEVDTAWKCSGCNGTNTLRIGVHYAKADN
ncbi:hypothetical protein A9257_04350 [Vibrio cyclitrophicus]|jgi:hypothetical protein|uniref:hypothetical protein n=1 Tax=Vibrio cyclitrophicus TaxID=47951 RepID=UPI0007EE99B8|nr:hypothetical protein [Vibrio cyclitrophicus]OBT04979.1 hypothetical protein A9257_04350 [Vibrio cyclitrophicus]